MKSGENLQRKRVTLPYIEALDGLRGLAVLGILLFHAGHLSGGWLGVDLFFVLSGFLITSLLLLEYEANESVSLSQFWGRRARRLLPALLLTLFGVCLYALGYARPEELARIRADVIATLFYVANWHSILAGHDYWEIFRAPSPLDHTWSLAIEEQFYLLWPPTFILLMRRARGSERPLTLAALGLAMLSALWMAVLYDPAQGTARVYYGTDTRLSAMFIGIAIASGLRHRVRNFAESNPRPHRTGDLAAMVGLAILLWAAITLRGETPIVYRGGLFALGLASGAVIVGVLFAPRGYVARGLSLPPLRWLGNVSYGVYLWHWPLYLILTPERVGWAGWPLTSLRIAVTLAIASISYFGLERPIRKGDRSGQVLIGAAITASLAVLACTWFVTGSGQPAADNQTVDQKLPLDAIIPGLDVLLIGDSLAVQLRTEFMNESRKRGYDSHVNAVEGCGSVRSSALRFLSGATFNLQPCVALRNHWVREVTEAPPKVVILLEGWAGEGNKRIAGRWTNPCRPDFDTTYRRDLGFLVRHFEAAGSKTVIATVPAPIPEDLSENYLHQWGGRSDEVLGSLFRERMVCLNDVRREVAGSTDAHLVDLEALVCPEGHCPSERDGFKTRPDGMHFTGRGAAWVSSWLFDQVESMGMLAIHPAKYETEQSR